MPDIKRYLEKKWVDFLKGKPESGMGYQKVDIKFDNGGAIATVYNCSEVMIDRAFGKIKNISLVGEPTSPEVIAKEILKEKELKKCFIENKESLKTSFEKTLKKEMGKNPNYFKVEAYLFDNAPSDVIFDLGMLCYKNKLKATKLIEDIPKNLLDMINKQIIDTVLKKLKIKIQFVQGPHDPKYVKPDWSSPGDTRIDFV